MGLGIADVCFRRFQTVSFKIKVLKIGDVELLLGRIDKLWEWASYLYKIGVSLLLRNQPRTKVRSGTTFDCYRIDTIVGGFQMRNSNTNSFLLMLLKIARVLIPEIHGGAAESSTEQLNY